MADLRPLTSVGKEAEEEGEQGTDEAMGHDLDDISLIILVTLVTLVALV
jgi:hypothetical protein